MKTYQAAAFVLASVALSPAKGASPQPNILLIHCDQLRFDCLGYNGNTIVNTPNIDKLARLGMKFENAYTPIPTSCPARQCQLTGVWPEIHRGLWNYDITLPVQEFQGETWTEKMPDYGYRMGYVGKWHVSATRTPLNFGFEDYVPEQQYGAWLKEQGIANKRVRTGKIDYMGGYAEIDKRYNINRWGADKVIELIEKYGDSPWFIRYDPSEPHLPCFPAKEFYDKYKDVEIPAWGNFGDRFRNKPYIQKQQLISWELDDYRWSDWEKYMRSYYGVVEQLDDAVGLLVEWLEKNGLMQNTIVIFMTDHGDAAGSHGMIDKHYVLYEEEVHVPMIVRWDGVVKPGSACEQFVCSEIDLAATIPQLAGWEFETQGASLLPILKGEKDTVNREYAFSNFNGQQFGLYTSRMVRDHRYKYIWNLTDVDEFYDLEKDPYEMKNMIGSARYKEEIKRLREVLYKDLKRRKDRIAAGRWASDTQLLKGEKHIRK